MKKQYEDKLVTLAQQIQRTETERDKVLKDLGKYMYVHVLFAYVQYVRTCECVCMYVHMLYACKYVHMYTRTYVQYICLHVYHASCLGMVFVLVSPQHLCVLAYSETPPA